MATTFARPTLGGRLLFFSVFSLAMMDGFRATLSAQMMVSPVATEDPGPGDNPAPLTEPTPSTVNPLIATLLDTSITYVRDTTYVRIRQPENPQNPGAPTVVAADPRYVGTFSGALTPANTLLPEENRTSSNQFYEANGIGFGGGVVIATGICDDDLSSASYNTVPAGRGIGVDGPNNGWEATNDGIPNQGDAHFSSHRGTDEDYRTYVLGTSGVSSFSKDACAIDFVIEVDRPGFLEVDLVFATDEWPASISSLLQNNDSVGVLIKRLPQEDGSVPAPYSANYENLFKVRFRQPTTSIVIDIPFDMRLLIDNNAPPQLIKLLRANRMAPAPSDLVGSASDPFIYNSNQYNANWYDVEFSGFTYKLRRASGQSTSATTPPLPIGGWTNSYKVRYQIKIVIQDQGEQGYLINSAVFIPTAGIRFRSVKPGDFNLDGNCDGSDFNIWNANKLTSGKNYLQGDANFDGGVDGEDFNIWNANKFTGGGWSYSDADCDNDGDVDGNDMAILQSFKGLANLATRFGGDIDRDGDVDQTDADLMAAVSP